MVKRVCATRSEAAQPEAGAIENHNLARERVIADYVAAVASLVGIGRITDTRRMRRPVDMTVQVDFVHPVPVDLGDQEMPIRERENHVRAAEKGWRVVAA